MKRIVAVCFCVCLILSVCQVGAFATDGKLLVSGSVELFSQGDFPCVSMPAKTSKAAVPQKKAAARSGSKTIYETVRDGIVAREDIIDIGEYGIVWEDDDTVLELIGDVYGYVLNYYPECFAVGSQYQIGGVYRGDIPYVTMIVPDYLFEAEEYKNVYAEYTDMVNRIIAKVPAEFSDLEKAVYVHDYFVANFCFDLSEEISNVYHFLKQGKGVCQAYMLSYNAVMRGLGMECYSAVNDKQRHAWNVIKIGKNYYHVDLTQDDPIYCDPDTLKINTGITGRISREYLLLSDKKVTDTGTHDFWEVVGPAVTCSDTSYDNHAWRSVLSPMCYLNGRWYGTDDGGDTNGLKLISFGRNFSGTAKNHLTLSSHWSAGAGEDYFWNGVYSGLFALGDTLYFNDPTSLVSFSVRTGKSKTLYRLTGSATQEIFGLRYMGGGRIRYSLCTHPCALESFAEFTLSMGDTDGDSVVTANDLINVRKYLLSVGKSDFNYGLIDLDEDGKVTVIDLVRLKKMMV